MAFSIQRYMTGCVYRVITDALRATGGSPKQKAFYKSFAAAATKATAKRFRSEKQGEHVPAFLIASITSACNLHCAGCYSRENHACSDEAPVKQMTADEWDRIFREASEIGISFILLAGGEPLLRKDVVERAANHRGILFPIFTNGVFLNDQYLGIFDENRNLLPVISIEGSETVTDARRGKGVYRKVIDTMLRLREKQIAFGASITVTKENMREVFSTDFLGRLGAFGCKAVIFVEYVPMAEESDALAPGDGERVFMEERLKELRRHNRDMVFISFPGDEKRSGGCVAAGRGFFHINSHGGAEPCPFSPFSDVNVREGSLKDALRSPLFRALQDTGILTEDHEGGCTLHKFRDEVEALAAMNA